MNWLKRNSYFATAGALALALVGLGGSYLRIKWQLNNDAWTQLVTAVERLDQLRGEVPKPGPGGVDSIQAAKDQTEKLTAVLERLREQFQRIPPIPDGARISGPDFARALACALRDLRRDASNATVQVAPNYCFSYQAEDRKGSFHDAELAPLAAQLGEVKAICDILFKAKVNGLDEIRRERVSNEDNSRPRAGYLEENSITNSLAVLTHYELTFRCFTAELAAVLSGFVNSSNGLVVTAINVEHFPVMLSPAEAAPPPVLPSEAHSSRSLKQSETVPGPVPAAATASKGGLPTVLDETELRITMAITIIKLRPANDTAGQITWSMPRPR